MASQNGKNQERPREPNPPPDRGRKTDDERSPAGAQAIGTNDPRLMPGPREDPDWTNHPDQSMAVETSQIRGPNEAFSPNFVVVPVETRRPTIARDSESDGKRNQHDEKDEGRSEHGDDEADDKSGKGKKHGKWSQPPSLTRTLLYAGVVSLVCGIAGAWGYAHFFGSKKSGDDKSSSKSSGSDKDSGSSNGSQSGENSEPGKGSDSGKDSGSDQQSNASKKSVSPEKLLQAQAAWMDAVKELREARSGAKDARHSEEEFRAILDFFKKEILAAGRSGDATLTEMFWAGGPGKDVSLRRAVDNADSHVAERFSERPLAEASVREMLGLAYLNLGAPEQAVTEYERALALREATQGLNDPATASCRNELAIVYRLAGRASEGGQLFHRGTDPRARASALAIRGSTLLLQKQPAEAALKLRECLRIREKEEPDHWTTFDTKSMLGEALLEQGQFVEAESLLVSGYEGMKQRQDKIPTQEMDHLVKAINRIVKLYRAWGKPEEVKKWQIELETWEAARKLRTAAPTP